MSEGRPWPFIVTDFLSGGDISNDEIDKVEETSFAFIDHSDICFELSVTLRNYLSEFKGKPVYQKECEWVEWLFARMDNRFANPKALSPDEARSFQMQIDREVYRRRKLMELSIENRNNR